MRNSWKGLVVGGLTGAAVGLFLDFLARLSEKAAAAKDLARERAPQAADWAKGVAEGTATRIRGADVPEKVRGLAKRVSDSDAAQRAKEGVSSAVTTARHAASGSD